MPDHDDDEPTISDRRALFAGLPPSSPPSEPLSSPSSPRIRYNMVAITPGLFTMSSLSSIPMSAPNSPTFRHTIHVRASSCPSSPIAHAAPDPSRILHDDLGPLILSDGFEMLPPLRTPQDRRRAPHIQRQAERLKAAEEAEKLARTAYDEVLTYLESRKLSFGGLVEYVSTAENYRGHARYRGFFDTPARVLAVLNAWVSPRNSQTGRETVHGWAVNYLKEKVSSEGDCATRANLLQTRTMTLDATFALDFSLLELRNKLLSLCPTMMGVLQAFSTTTRQIKEMSDNSRERKDVCITTQALIGLGARSQGNSYAKYVLGLYAYACGAQRQVISVLSHLGLTCSYSSLIGLFRSRDSDLASTSGPSSSSSEPPPACGPEPQHGSATGAASASPADPVEDMSDEDYWTLFDELGSIVPVVSPTSVTSRGDNSSHHTSPGLAAATTPPKPRTQNATFGFLKRLSNACRTRTREQASTNLLAYVYDNINMLFKIAEQVLGRKDSQQNGTCATAFKLFDASPEAMRTADLMESFVRAPPLRPEDVLLTAAENRELTDRLVHTALRVLVKFGGTGFERFKSDVVRCTPETADKIPLHKTEIFPLPAMHIDESSTTGNADVLNAIFKEVGLDMSSSEFTSTVKLVAGDQLSVARIRSLVAARAGHDTFANSFLWAVCMPGLFHYKMAATHGILELHYGSSSTSDPGSLAFANTVVDHKPITLTSLPSFHVCRDHIFLNVYARILVGLQNITKSRDLDEYAAAVEFPELQQHVRQAIEQYANPEVVQKMRRQREAEIRRRQAAVESIDEFNPDENLAQEPLKVGDMVFENAVLFLRDGLVLREFTDAIKAGDSGRVVVVLKLWALAFRGSGRTKYAHEMLHLIHNLKHVWPDPLKKIIMNNWLVNPTGKDDSWVEFDLMQEHNNFWTKTIYRAHGSNASWEWLAMVSPTINTLRRLATHINASLGARQGSKHTSPGLAKDIAELVRSLTEHGVYEVEPGRLINGTTKRVIPNAVSLGCAQLAGPLADFNTQLLRIQRRCTMVPLVGKPYITSSSFRQPHLGSATSTLPTTAVPPPLQPTPADNLPGSSGEDLHPAAIDSSEDDDDTQYWQQVEDLDVHESVPFSLDSAQDLDLDFDDDDVDYIE